MDAHTLLYSKLNYWIFILLMMLGLWAMVSKRNLIKKVMGMGIFQSAIILFYVSTAAKNPGADIPIYPHDLIHPPHEVHATAESGHDEAPSVIEHAAEAHHENQPSAYRNDPPGHEQMTGEHPQIVDKIDPDTYNNPLPHVLMLTAIVVGVATLGVALSLVQRIYRQYGSIEENEVLEVIARETDDELLIEASTAPKPKTTGSHA